MSQREIHQAGFTLIEMLAALAIIAVMAAIGLPLIKGPPDRLRLAEASKRIQDVMRLARSMAIATNNDELVAIDTATGLITSAAGTSRLGEVRADLVVADTERRSASTGGVRFFADGSSTGATVTLHFRSLSQRIAVDWLTGRATRIENVDAP